MQNYQFLEIYYYYDSQLLLQQHYLIYNLNYKIIFLYNFSFCSCSAPLLDWWQANFSIPLRSHHVLTKTCKLRQRFGLNFTNILRAAFTPGVNFTNVLRAAFTYVSCVRSFFVLKLQVCTLLVQDCWHKSCTQNIAEIDPRSLTPILPTGAQHRV